MKPPLPPSYLSLYRGPAILLVLVAVLPLCARGHFSYLLSLAQLCGIYAIIVTGLTLLLGYTGQVSLGHAGFYGLGAYAAAILATVCHLPVWLAILLALTATGVCMFVAGVSLLRLKGHYLALATLCTGIIIYEVITKMEITGGAAGLYDLPEIALLGQGPLAKTYLIWAVVILVLLWAVHLTESPYGRALRAIDGDEDAAAAMGVRVFPLKLTIFIVSGVLAALAGILYAFVYSPSYLGPEEFSIMHSVSFLIMVVIGGMGSVWGGLAGAVVLTGLHELLNLLGERLHSTDMAKYEHLVFGALLIVILVFSRDGMMPGLRRSLLRLAGKGMRRA